MIEQAKRIRPEKLSIAAETAARLDNADYVFLLGFTRLKVSKLEDLRRQLHACDARFLVVKNSTVRRLAADRGWKDVDQVLAGPNGIVAGRGDVAQTAKILRKFTADLEGTAVRGGLFEGQSLTAQDVEALATLPSRERLYGMLVGTLAAPMVQLAGVLQQKLASLVYVLKAVQDKKQQQ